MNKLCKRINSTASSPRVSYKGTDTNENILHACSIITHSGLFLAKIPINVNFAGIKSILINALPIDWAISYTLEYLNHLNGLSAAGLTPKYSPLSYL